MHLSGLVKASLWVDLASWRLVGWLSSGVMDGVPADFVDSTFLALSKLVATVDANSKVQEWKAKHPMFYDAKEIVHR